jgi:outer membrane lipoprotein LolB
MSVVHDRRRVFGAALLVSLLSACAQLPRGGASRSTENFWSGRLSLQVQSEPAQSLSAAFELKGAADRGELRLSTPLGTTLLTARWSPTEALLEAENQIRRFPDIDTLLLQATGASVPVAALFEWLKGRQGEAEGWSADLSRHADGRIAARRTLPAPAAQLRIVLDALP